IFTKAGASVTTLNRSAIEALPQGDNQPFNQLLLQFPGVTQDNAANGGFHIRNEHGNIQYRINGVQIPDGISGFNQFLDPVFIGSASLIVGALPAQYGLRTAGVLDIETRTGAFAGGSVSLYGGVRGTITPTFVYG
ncbi:Plug domain-containing protein, partial|nr:Plug domain-containing protein [Escherichia coli]